MSNPTVRSFNFTQLFTQAVYEHCRYPDISYARNVLNKWTEHWFKFRFGNLAIIAKDSPGHTIGFGGLTVRSFECVTVNNLGYRFETEAWGKGYATEFARFLVAYGFSELNLQQISATVRAHHLVSQNVLKKSGLRYVREIHDVPDATPSLLYSIKREARK
ncbi:GNAT family N-acetyltransferase [Klebsiella variicola]|nr:GNAT family N-acetyltransferase [Klebsiella variicola]